MSSVNVIVSIIVLLAALVCYAFISQTVKNKREQRNRLLAALKAKSRNFKFMLNGFPQGFLPRELTLLVQRSLIDVCEQLARMEPREPSHVQDLQAVSAQLAETQRHAKPHANINLESPQQIKEVKMCLEELHRFIFQLEAKTTLTRAQADAYRAQIRQLVLQVTVDQYVIQGRAAEQMSKTKLAVHYFDLALNLLIRESKPGQFEGRIAQLRDTLDGLKRQLHDEQENKTISDRDLAEQQEIEDEWNRFGSDEDIWKKKHAYD